MKFPKVDNFLRSLSTFQNFDSAKMAFQAAKFSEAERKQLENQMRNDIYKPQLTRLAATVSKKPRPPKPPSKPVQVRQLEQKNRIDAIIKQNQAEVSKISTQSARVTPSSAAQTVIGTAPKITSLSHNKIYPGQNLIIHGTNFLPQGTVTFTFGSASFNGVIDMWTNDTILVTLPSTVQGLPETDGNVTVRKQNSMHRADALIRFMCHYDFENIRSTKMTNRTPYDMVIYIMLLFMGGFTTPFCSVYDISFPDCPSYNFKNGAVIAELDYDSDVWFELGSGEDTEEYIGWDGLPKRTQGEICEQGLNPGALYCEVSIMFPRGVSWH
jgi:hypothetical protein